MVDYEIFSSDFIINRDRMTLLSQDKKLGVIRVRYGLLSTERSLVVNLPLKPVLLGGDIVLPIGQ